MYYWILFNDYFNCKDYKKLYLKEKQKRIELEKKLDDIIYSIIKIE